MKDVEASVESQEKDVMSSDVLDISEFVYHVKLGQNGQSLQPNTEGPQEIHRVEGFVDNNGCEKGASVEVVVREGV